MYNEKQLFMEFYKCVGIFYAGKICGALSHTIMARTYRLIVGDPDNCVGVKDLSGQVKRLAECQFDQVKGALAPVTIYDCNQPTLYERMKGGLDTFPKMGSVTLLGTASLVLILKSLSECQANGITLDSNLSHECWTALGSFLQQPLLIPAVATAYVAANMGIFPLIVRSVLVSQVTDFSLNSILNFYKLPLYMSSFVLLLNNGLSDAERTLAKPVMIKGRFTMLGSHLTEKWSAANLEKDPLKILDLFKTAWAIKNRATFLKTALVYHFNLKNIEEASSIMDPLFRAVETILITKKEV